MTVFIHKFSQLIIQFNKQKLHKFKQENQRQSSCNGTWYIAFIMAHRPDHDLVQKGWVLLHWGIEYQWGPREECCWVLLHWGQNTNEDPVKMLLGVITLGTKYQWGPRENVEGGGCYITYEKISYMQTLFFGCYLKEWQRTVSTLGFGSA